jgi:hypothetical protein
MDFRERQSDGNTHSVLASATTNSATLSAARPGVRRSAPPGEANASISAVTTATETDSCAADYETV